MSAESVSAATHAQVRVREPLGERSLPDGLTVGGSGAGVVVPGAAAGPALTLERRGGIWTAVPQAEPAVLINGSWLTAARALSRDDVLTVGDAQLIVTDLSRTLLHVSVCHLAGNATVPPVSTLAALPGLEVADDEDLTILPPPPAPVAPAAGARLAAFMRGLLGRRIVAVGAGAAVLLVALLVWGLFVFFMRAVPLDVQPRAARLSTPGTWVAWRAGTRLWLLPGKHLVSASADGYVSAGTRVTVGRTPPATVRLHLAPLPGRVHIDTGPVAAVASIDGAEAGRVPGTFDVPAGHHTVVLRAPRYLDAVSPIDVHGARALQELKVTLSPSWGKLAISSVTPGARVRVDGVERGTVPVTVEADSGVRDIQVYAEGRATWRSSVVLKAGETLSVGPVALGAPDARLHLTSVPAGAEVSVGGTQWGRTPGEISLPPGVAHWVVLTLPGYLPWSQSVFAEPGREVKLEAHLAPELMSLSVHGQPDGAEVRVDGVLSGHTPQVLKLPAVDHRIEVRAPGYLSFEGSIGGAAGLSRTLEYHLMAAERVRTLTEQAPTLTTYSGSVLHLVPPGTFTMGSDPHDPDHRANERPRRVLLSRAFYLGVTEVTNGEFRQFQAGHSSGSISGRSIDEPNMPVTGVTWEEAAEYCNWLSEHDGLTPAYDLQGDHLVLRRPVTLGYRLPTEAEWEYAARYAGPGKFQRYAWGDSLPVPPQAGNLAGAETSRTLPASLADYRDPYPVVAPAGQFPANALGLHDMEGNVSEWVNDWYAAVLDPRPGSDPLGPDAGTLHGVRGPSWQSAHPAELRLALRQGADEAAPTLGFRIARYADF